MTVPATPYKVSYTYTGSGSSTVFPYTFEIVLQSDLVVQHISTTNVITTLTLTTDYTVSGVQVSTGGNVTLVVPMVTGEKLMILRDPTVQQQTQLVEGGTYSGVAVMNALDLLTREVQAVKDRSLRSPHVPVNESPTDLAFTLPSAASRALGYQTYDGAGNPTVSQAIVAGTTVSAAMIPVVTAATQTLAGDAFAIKATGSTVSRSLSARANDVVNALDWGADNTGVGDSSAAIQAAITSLGASGGRVLLPRGSYKIATRINIPEFCGVEGEGQRATRVLNYTGGDYAFQLGGSSGALHYGCSLRDLAINFQALNDKGVQLLECCGALVSDLYLEGYLGSLSTRTNLGIKVNGGNASSFFNEVRNIICNHMHEGYQIEGTVNATSTCFTNCTCLGDLGLGDVTSVGFLNDTSQGNGSTFTGGNFEDCNIGVELGHLALPMSFFGTRFEGNTYDIYNSSAYPTLFSGCVNIVVVYNDSGLNVNPVVIDNCTNGTYFPIRSRALYGPAAPTSGTWTRGDLVWLDNTVAGDGIGFVCIASGTPGTWSRFGFVALEGSATYDPPSLGDGVGATTTVTVTGAALGDYADASFSLDLQGITVTAYVSSANTVSVRFQNESGGTLDLASGTLRARVEKA